MVSSNGPMHEECARYAIAACPFLSNANYQGKKDVEEGRWIKVVLAMMSHGVSGKNVRPNRIALCTSGAYTCDTKRQILDFQVPYWLTVDWDAIPSRKDENEVHHPTQQET